MEKPSFIHKNYVSFTNILHCMFIIIFIFLIVQMINIIVSRYGPGLEQYAKSGYFVDIKQDTRTSLFVVRNNLQNKL